LPDLFGASDQLWRVTGPSGTVHGEDGMSGHPPCCLDHFADTVALPVAQVIGPSAHLVIVQSTQSQDVGLGQVEYVDVVTDASTVVSGIIVAIHLNVIALAQCHLKH
jgi:hypothetical protein